MDRRGFFSACAAGMVSPSFPRADAAKKIIFNFNSAILSKDDAGRAVKHAIAAYEKRTGKNILDPRT